MCLIVCFLSNYRGKIRSVLYSPHTRKLLSSGEDGQVGVWDVDIQREETAEWGAGNTCEKCGIPFFWNVKEMWSKKTIGVRQVYYSSLWLLKHAYRHTDIHACVCIV